MSEADDRRERLVTELATALEEWVKAQEAVDTVSPRAAPWNEIRAHAERCSRQLRLAYWALAHDVTAEIIRETEEERRHESRK